MPKASPRNTTPPPVTRSNGVTPPGRSKRKSVPPERSGAVVITSCVPTQEPFPAEVLRAIDRLKAISVEAYDSLLLADGAPNPDYRLLDLCSEVIHVYRQHNEIERRWRALALIDANPSYSA